MFDWNDLQHFLAVARHGSTLAAGRALGVDQSTVLRRIAALERHLGQPLVIRHPTGYRLSEFGQGLLPHAERVGQAVAGLEQQLEAVAHDAVGVVRVTCPEPLVQRLAGSPLLDRFRERHPRLRVEFVSSDRYLDLMKGEADLALRSGDTEDGALIGRKIGDSYWAVYGSPAYLAQAGRPDSVAALAQHALIGFDDSMAGHRAAAWLRGVAPGARIVARSASVLGLLASAKAGLGLAPLPTALGDADADLVRVLGPIEALTRIWRVLVHPDLRHTPRVAALFDFIVDEVDALRPILGG